MATEPHLGWRIGFEIELLAPRGLSRRDLAVALADRPGCRVEPFFHPQAELSEVPGAPIFENLTLGYQALDPEGGLIARCADDLTLQRDLDRAAPPQPGWYRIAGDDARLLRLIMRHADPAAPLDRILDPVAALFGTRPAVAPDGMVRLADDTGAPIAIAAPLPGERERPCEIITPPIDDDHGARLEALLGPARALGFTIPQEAALHLHFDAAPLCSAATVARLVALLSHHGRALKALVGANPRCRRLGDWPPALLEQVAAPDFAALAWPAARARLAAAKLSKYCDFNLLNLVRAAPDKRTFEVRILPVTLEVGPILRAAALFEALLRWAMAATGAHPVPETLPRLIAALPLEQDLREAWGRDAAPLAAVN